MFFPEKGGVRTIREIVRRLDTQFNIRIINYGTLVSLVMSLGFAL